MAGPTKATRPDPLPFVSGSCWTGTERSTLATARSLAAPDRGGPARATRRRTRPARPREAHFTRPRHSAALAAGDNAKTGLNRDSFGTLSGLLHHPPRPTAPRTRKAREEARSSLHRQLRRIRGPCGDRRLRRECARTAPAAALPLGGRDVRRVRSTCACRQPVYRAHADAFRALHAGDAGGQFRRQQPLPVAATASVRMANVRTTGFFQEYASRKLLPDSSLANPDTPPELCRTP